MVAVMERIAIVVGNPRQNTYCEALGTAYYKGAIEAGHQAELFVLSRMNFDAILHKGFDELQALEPDMQLAHDAILGASRLVLIYPLWLGGMPALMKGFLERVFQPDLLQSSKQGHFVHLLKGKRARIIVTMGMPGFVFRWWFGALSLKMLKRNILGFQGARRIRSSVIGNIMGMGPDGREKWLVRAKRMGASAI